MTNSFVAVRATIQFAADTSAVIKDFSALDRNLSILGKNHAVKYARGFKTEYKALSVGGAISADITKNSDPKGSGKKTGETFAKSFSKASLGILKSIGKGFIVGLGIEALKFGISQITKSYRSASEQIEKNQKTLKALNESVSRISEATRDHNALLEKNADLQGIAAGRISAATGEYETLLNVLNRLTDEKFKIQVETITEDRVKAQESLDETRAEIRNASLPLGPSINPRIIGSNLVLRFFNKGKIQKLSKEADDFQQKIDELNESQSISEQAQFASKKGNALFVEEQRELLDLQNQLEIAQKAGNRLRAQELEDQLEIKRVKEEILRFDLVTLQNADGSETTAKQRAIEAEQLARDRVALERQAEARGRNRIARREELAEAKRLFQETRTPVERYRQELDKLNAIKLDPKRLELIGGQDGIERLLIQDLKNLASRTKDLTFAEAALEAQIDAGNISTSKRETILNSLINLSGRAAKIEEARRFKQSNASPIENLDTELTEINKFQADISSDPERRSAAGGDETFSRARIVAIQAFAAATNETDKAISVLIKELNAGRISAEAFGQSFQDITDAQEGAGAALTRLNSLGGNISSTAYTAAADAIKQSTDFQQDLNDAKQLEVEKLQQKNELEIQSLRVQIARAEANGDEARVANLEDEIALLEQKNELLGIGVSADDAETLAPNILEQQELAELQGRVKNTFSGAFRAAMNGNFDGFLRGKLENAAANMFDRALDSLLDTLFSALGNLNFGGGGSGLGGLASLFAGFFADGGTIGRGQFGIVGEAGPELAFAGSAPVSIVPFKPTSFGQRHMGDLMGGGRVQNSSVVMNIQTPNAHSFRRAQASIESDMALAQRRASRDL